MIMDVYSIQWLCRLLLAFLTTSNCQILTTKPVSRVLEVVAGQRISLSCMYQSDSASIKWFKNNQNVENLDFVLYDKAYIDDNNQAIVEVTAVKDKSYSNDAGNYRCVSGGQEKTFQVYVKGYGAAPSITPATNRIYVVEPAQINISCTFTGDTGTTVTWQRQNQPVENQGFSVNSVSSTEVGQKTTTKTAIKASSLIADSGEYRCVAGSEESTIYVEVFKVETKEDVYTYPMEEASLSCNPTVPDINSVPVNYARKWQRNHQDLNTVEDHETKYTVYDANFTLVLNNPRRDDADAYQCVLVIEDQSLPNNTFEVAIDVNFYATPFVKKFDKSKNLIQGDPLEIKCAVLGYPRANVTWKKDDVVLEANERIVFKPYGGVDNTILYIEKIQFEDKGLYMCHAAVAAGIVNGTYNRTILVRVKDKLAALWPFLGIVAEVIILCIIIFIYEKKRSKDDNSDDDDTNVKGASSNAAESNEVRQRNVRT